MLLGKPTVPFYFLPTRCARSSSSSSRLSVLKWLVSFWEMSTSWPIAELLKPRVYVGQEGVG